MKTTDAKSARTRDDRPDSFRVGDILVSRWGRDRVNANFSQVIEADGDRVVIRDIGHELADARGGGEDANPQGDYVVAAPGKFRDRPMAKTVRRDADGRPYVVVGGEKEKARRWDGASQLNYEGSATSRLKQRGGSALPRR